MGRFLKIVFGSCLGSLLAVIVIFFAFGSFIAGSLSNVESKPSVESNSILYLDFSQGIPELTGNKDEQNFSLKMEEPAGLHDLIRVIEEAATDDDIKGIYLRDENISAPLTTLRQIRRAIITFKESGKFVTAYAPVMTQSAYYLATAADEVNIGPLGIVDFRGLGAEVPYYKNFLDKAGINMEVFKVGDYKSAVEPYLLSEMSAENRAQLKDFLGDISSIIFNDIAEGRGMTAAAVSQAADEMKGWQTEDLVASGLVDGILTRSEVDKKMHELVGVEMDQSLNLISSTDYFAARLNPLGTRGEVAVLIAEGTIVDGMGSAGSIGDKKYVNELQKLMEDDNVEAVVLRINSGGGSASSSENMWYAVEQLKAAGKPVIVSMGDYAASGGYYMAAGADAIIAEPTTITGSIGVFTVFPVLKELMNEKIGVNFDTVNVSRNATALSTFQNVSPEQRAVLTARTRSIYQQFMQRVADGRNLPIATVENLAGGRVYSGEDALGLKLVDQLGSLNDAIALAAEKAGLEKNDYSVSHYPAIKPALERLFDDFLGEGDGSDKVTSAMLRQQLGDEAFEQFQLIREMTQLKGTQARLPVVVKF